MNREIKLRAYFKNLKMFKNVSAFYWRKGKLCVEINGLVASG